MPNVYRYIRFVSYELDTSPGTDGSGNRAYIGDANPDNDIRDRCAIMKRAMAIAAKKVATSSETLNLFMAPEFYFRGRAGAYPVEKISSIMDSLRGEASKPIYKHWLFVFGTALGFLESLLTTEVFNIALVQKGGADDEDRAHDKVVYKEYVSHIDFLRNPLLDWSQLGNRLVTLNGGVTWIEPTQGSRDIGLSTRTNPVGEGKETQKVGYGGSGIFTIDNITFGLEVCLDHYKGRLKASPQKSDEPPILVHLIPSAGMRIAPDNVVADAWRNGCVFNVDGLGAGAHSDAQACSPFGLSPINLEGQHDIASELTATDKIMDLFSFKGYGTIKWFEKHRLFSS